MASPHLLELSGVTKSFTLPTGERLDILRGIDLTVDPGEVTAIVGTLRLRQIHPAERARHARQRQPPAPISATAPTWPG